MNNQDVDLLLAQNGKPCISITVPTAKYGRARTQNPELIERAINRARLLLEHSAWPKSETKLLDYRLDQLNDNLEFIRLQEGLAIFLSADFFKIQLLPFQVKEKVILAERFELRDLIYYDQFLQPYYLLALSKKRVRLFKGSGRDLQEIINNDFPKKYTEEYEYERPSIGSPSSSGLKSFERDKSVMENIRTSDFFRHADHLLSKYIKDGEYLFVAGVNEELADFDRISHHLPNIAGKIQGNFDIDAVHPLAETAWSIIKEKVRTTHSKLVAKIDDDFGSDLALEGIRNIWRAAREGRGRTLLLEKDYHAAGYIHPSDPDHLLLTPPVGDYEIISDATNDIIRIVQEKGGEIKILENGDLKDHEHIALLLRY
jgi:hypothetical protein